MRFRRHLPTRWHPSKIPTRCLDEEVVGTFWCLKKMVEVERGRSWQTIGTWCLDLYVLSCLMFPRRSEPGEVKEKQNKYRGLVQKTRQPCARSKQESCLLAKRGNPCTSTLIRSEDFVSHLNHQWHQVTNCSRQSVLCIPGLRFKVWKKMKQEVFFPWLDCNIGSLKVMFFSTAPCLVGLSLSDMIVLQSTQGRLHASEFGLGDSGLLKSRCTDTDTSTCRWDEPKVWGEMPSSYLVWMLNDRNCFFTFEGKHPPKEHSWKFDSSFSLPLIYLDCLQ